MYRSLPTADTQVQACDNTPVKLSAKADYAVRAVLVLAAHDDPHPLKGELIASAQQLPVKFVENITRMKPGEGLWKTVS